MIYDFQIAEEIGEEIGEDLIKLTNFLKDQYNHIINRCFKKN